MRVVIGLLLLFSVALIVTAQEELCFEKGGVWNADESQCNIQFSVEIDIDYPLALAEHEFIGEAIDLFLEWVRGNFMTFATDASGWSVPAPWTLAVDYEEFAFSDTIVSLKFTVYEYTGGAHGNTFFQTFVFDLDSEQGLILEDLFVEEFLPFEAISPLVQADLMEQLGEFADSQWIEDGTGVNPNNYLNFVVTGESLLFFFPPYQVAPYAAGPLTVEIPLAELDAILVPPFAMGS